MSVSYQQNHECFNCFQVRPLLMPVLLDTIGGPVVMHLCLECRLNERDDPQLTRRYCVMLMSRRIHLPGPAWVRLPHLRDEQVIALLRVYQSMFLRDVDHAHIPTLELVELVERVVVNGQVTPWWRIVPAARERVESFFRKCANADRFGDSAYLGLYCP